MISIAAALLCAALPALSSGASFDDLQAPQELLLELRQGSSAIATPAAKAPAYPLIERIALGSETDYWRTSVSFPLKDGRLVHVSGSKDRTKGDHDGYFMSFLVDGRAQPVWVAPDKKPVLFQVEGDTYSVVVRVGSLLNPVNDVKLMTHPENLRIRIARPGDPSFHCEFTAGQLVNAMRETGRRVDLGERAYYALYVQDIQDLGEQPAAASLLPGTYTLWLLPEMKPQVDSKGNVKYKFGWSEHIEVRADQAEGQDGLGGPRIARPSKKQDDRMVLSPYGFHIVDEAGGKILEVYDIAGAPRP